MDVVASGEAVELIRRRGGRLSVWADDRVCCGGTRFVKASTSASGLAGEFKEVECGVDFELFLRVPRGSTPNTLDIDVRGRRHPRVEASWDGCAYLI